MKESTGLDLSALLSGVVGGSVAAARPVTVEVKAGQADQPADAPAKAASAQEEGPAESV